MTIKFLAGVSTGVAFETHETRTVNVTAENLSAVVGYGGQTITYTATVLDSTVVGVPATFVATLKINGNALITDQIFDVGVYTPGTGALSLDFTVPSAIGAFTVALDWAEQII